MKISDLFPPNAPVMSLPTKQQPRVYFTNSTPSQRWQHSRLYPAFRPSARLYRLFLRGRALLGIGEVWQNDASTWKLGDFVSEVLPAAEAAVVLLGTPGPAQKITVQLWSKDNVLAYLKYAQRPAARVRLAKEQTMLSTLPKGVGPILIKYDTFANGMALITTPIVGKALPARLPPHPTLKTLLEKLVKPRSYQLDDHPWIKQLSPAFREGAKPWLGQLSSREWPSVFLHGDFAPWNVIGGSAVPSAIDWEYGSSDGLPFHDLSYYLLQVAALIYRWSPYKAKKHAVNYLTQDSWPSLNEAEAESMVNLVAYYAYKQAETDGHNPQAPLQVWRHSIWTSQL